MTTLKNQHTEQRSFHDGQVKGIDSLRQLLKTFESESGEERRLVDMITRLHESKAELEADLQRKESEVKTLNQRCTELDDQNRRNHSDVTVLNKQIAALQFQLEIDQSLPERFRDSEHRNQELRSETRRLEHLLAQHEASTKGQKEDSVSLRRQMEGLKAQLKDAESAATSFRVEKKTLEAEASLKLEAMRAELDQGIEAEKSALEIKYDENIGKLTRSKNAAELKSVKLEGEIKRVRKESVASGEKVADLEKQLQDSGQRSKELSKAKSAQEQKARETAGELQLLRDTSAARIAELQSLLEIVSNREAEITKDLDASTSLKKTLAPDSCDAAVQTVIWAISPPNSAKLTPSSGLSITRPFRDESITLPNQLHADGVNDGWDEILGSLVIPKILNSDGSQELPYTGGQRTVSNLHAAVLASSKDCSVGSLHEAVDLIATPDISRNTSGQFESNRINNSEGITLCEQQKVIVEETQQIDVHSGNTEPTFKSQQKTQLLQDSPSKSRKSEEHTKLLAFGKNVFPSTPEQASSNARRLNSETRSNCSARRSPVKNPRGKQVLTTTNASERAFVKGNADKKSRRVPLKSLIADELNSQVTGEANQGKRKRASNEDLEEREQSSRAKHNKFHKATQEVKVSPAENGNKLANISNHNVNRRGKSRISQGEVRGLGPIIGSSQSPSKTTTNDQSNARRKKSQRKASGWCIIQ